MKKMNVLHDQYADAINAPDLHIWNNAAFDNGESEKPSAAKNHPIPSWVVMPDSCKENLKPLHPNGPTEKKTDPDEPESHQQSARHSRDIDAEIAEVESQIRQLKSRVEALCLEKKRKPANTCVNKTEIERRGRVVPAKFMCQPPSKRTEEEPPSSRVPRRRTMSMGPSEIQSIHSSRRGVSMGPSEILAANGGGGGAIPLTPLPPPMNRRKSCLLRPLQGIDEKTVSSNNRLPKQSATTGAAKKQSKKDNSFLASFRPKKLFRDDARSVPAVSKKKGRVVASRYSQVQAPATVQFCSKSSEVRKRADSASGGRVKKRWEIPNCVVIHKSSDGDCEEESPSPIPVLPDLLPRIRIGRCDFESPRDSGAAKRVAELVGKRSFFCPENEEGAPAPAEEVVLVCKALRFED